MKDILNNKLSDRLAEAIDIQQKRLFEDFQEMMQKPLSERVAKGHTLINLEVSVTFYESVPNSWCPPIPHNEKFIDYITIYCMDNCSRFREGSTVLISNGQYKFQMTLEKDGIDTMVLKSSDFDVKNNHLPVNNYPRTGWEMNEVYMTVTQRLLNAAKDTVLFDEKLKNNLDVFFSGESDNEYLYTSVNSTNNKSQDEAVAKALGCKRFHLIQGPPGTGKTYTIARIVEQLVSQGKSVLITGPTHTAINNCLNAITKRNLRCPIYKIGERSQAIEILDNQSIIRKTRLSHEEVIFETAPRIGNSAFLTISQIKAQAKAIVIGSTPYSLCYPASKKLTGWHFDYVIIDEAAQMSIPLSIAALAYSDKAVFVGDHKQLDPIIPHNTGNWLFSNSVFKHLIDLYPQYSSLLDTSYRLGPTLISIPSRLFYNGCLKSAIKDNIEFRSFIRCNSIISSSSNEVLYLHHEFDALGRSPYEAKLVSQLVSDLLANKISKNDIALLTPYRAQVREIKKALFNCNIISEDNLDEIIVDTIERMQGQEKKYVIFSLANSNPREIEDCLEFFYNPNRLNVAITRALTKCIVIANEKVFTLCDPEITSRENNVSVRTGQEVFWDFSKLATKIYANNEEEEW